MKNLLMGLCLMVSGACATSSSLGYNPDNIRDAVEIVCDRHDAYVQADPQLAPAVLQAAMGESVRCRTLLELNPVPAAALRVSLSPVLVRYRMYVMLDMTLTPPQMTMQLRTADLLQRLLDSNPN